MICLTATKCTPRYPFPIMSLEDKAVYLQKLLDFKESPLSTTYPLPTETLSPLYLFDRHIPDHLILKQISIVPSLASDIVNVTNTYLNNISALSVEKLAWMNHRPKSFEAHAIAEAHGYGLGMVCPLAFIHST